MFWVKFPARGTGESSRLLAAGNEVLFVLLRSVADQGRIKGRSLAPGQVTLRTALQSPACWQHTASHLTRAADRAGDGAVTFPSPSADAGCWKSTRGRAGKPQGCAGSTQVPLVSAAGLCTGRKRHRKGAERLQTTQLGGDTNTEVPTRLLSSREGKAAGSHAKGISSG